MEAYIAGEIKVSCIEREGGRVCVEDMVIRGRADQVAPAAPPGLILPVDEGAGQGVP
jgi:hypothetical protein